MKLHELAVMCFSMMLTPVKLVSSDQCPDSASPPLEFHLKGVNDGTCYILLRKETKSWYEAKDICQQSGWRLLEIKRPSKDQFYASFLTESGVSDCIWMGINDVETEGKWRWLDGSTPVYTRIRIPGLHVFTKWSYDCILFCKIYTEEWVWEQKLCVDTHPWMIMCERDTVPEMRTSVSMTSNIKQITRQVRSRAKRSKTAPVIKRLGGLSGYKLTSTPLQVSREVTNTMCSRRCTAIPQCVQFNFHGPSRWCALHTTMEVVEGWKQQQNGWEVWIVVP